jgi:hypothetical protein
MPEWSAETPDHADFLATEALGSFFAFATEALSRLT